MWNTIEEYGIRFMQWAFASPLNLLKVIGVIIVITAICNIIPIGRRRTTMEE